MAPWPAGVLVLSPHTENILLGSDIDLILGFHSGVLLHRRRRDTSKTKKCV